MGKRVRIPKLPKSIKNLPKSTAIKFTAAPERTTGEFVTSEQYERAMKTRGKKSRKFTKTVLGDRRKRGVGRSPGEIVEQKGLKYRVRKDGSLELVVEQVICESCIAEQHEDCPVTMRGKKCVCLCNALEKLSQLVSGVEIVKE